MPTIIFKPTEACNSNCVYCDVVRRKKPLTMTEELLATVFRRIDEYLRSVPSEEATLIWHGGEPLLLGVPYFQKAIELQSQFCSTTKERIHHALQSNLTLMREEYVPLFLDLGITQIGTSFDPIPHVRGGGSLGDSRSYAQAFFHGVNILFSHSIGWGFIYVVTKRSLDRPLEIFHFLANLQLSGGFMMNPVLVEGEDTTDIAITPLEYVRFLGAIFPVWWKHRHRYGHVEPFTMLTNNIINKQSAHGCVDSGRCAYSHLYIGPRGETSQCGRSGDWDTIHYGNIQDRSIADILSDPKRLVLLDRVEYIRNSDCKDCRFWGLCHGGCPLDALPNSDGAFHKSRWCAVTKVFVPEYFEPITGVRYEPS